jgi:hypothetical protein
VSEAHLSRAALTAWRDRGAGDRERLIAHLAACATCRHLAAELDRERPLDAGAQPVHLRPADFVATGRRAGRPPAHTVRQPWRLAGLAAAASLVVGAILVPAWFRTPPESGPRGGGAVVAPVAPVDATVATDSLAFEWTAGAQAGPLRLVVIALDNAGAPVIDRDVIGSRYAPTADERARLRAGTDYHWFVEYRGAGGGSGVSAAARFRLR